MAIKNIIAKGVGFSPGDTHFIVTHGFTAGAAPTPNPFNNNIQNWLAPSLHCGFALFFILWWETWRQSL